MFGSWFEIYVKPNRSVASSDVLKKVFTEIHMCCCLLFCTCETKMFSQFVDGVWGFSDAKTDSPWNTVLIPSTGRIYVIDHWKTTEKISWKFCWEIMIKHLEIMHPCLSSPGTWASKDGPTDRQPDGQTVLESKIFGPEKGTDRQPSQTARQPDGQTWEPGSPLGRLEDASRNKGGLMYTCLYMYIYIYIYTPLRKHYTKALTCEKK